MSDSRAPSPLAGDAAYYRAQAVEVDALLASLSDEERTADPEGVEKLDRQRHLWRQLADELDAYLDITAVETEDLF